MYIGADGTAAEQLSCASLLTSLLTKGPGTLTRFPLEILLVQRNLTNWAEITAQEVISGPGHLPWQKFVAEVMQKPFCLMDMINIR